MSATDPTDKQQFSKALANTYSTYGGTTPWERCQQYQAFLKYTGEHPNAGRVRVANNMLDDDQVPPSRVRPWLDGGLPDPMRAIQAAEAHGWLDWDAANPSTRVLNSLVAWIFAGGSVTRQYVPLLTVDDETQPCAMTLLETATSEPPTVVEREPTKDGRARATELRSGVDATALGRLLVALGAPKGPKHADQTDLRLPAYLDAAPRELRADWARTYVWLRGSVRDDLPERRVQISSERPASFRRGVHRLLEELIGDAVQGEPDDATYFLSPAATQVLFTPPTACDL